MSSWGLTNEALQMTSLGLLGVCIYFIKGALSELKQLKANQHQCQLTLQTTYRTKTEAERDSERQWDRIEDHNMQIAKLDERTENLEVRVDKLETK